MAVFTNNQVRHFYVVNNAVDAGKMTGKESEATLYAAGATLDPINGKYYKYKDAAGNVVRTDMITNVQSVALTKGSEVEHKAKIATIKMAKDKTPIVGQDYVVKVLVKNYVGMSDIYQLIKDGVARATTTTTADLFKALAVSLFRNMSREIVPMVSIGNGTSVIARVDSKGEPKTADGTTVEFSDKIVITELEQPQIIGKFNKQPVNYEVFFGTIKENGVETNEWATVEYTDGEVIISSGDIAAEMEWFYMGNRGDMYRGIGYPNNIETKYLVNPSDKYNFVDIHYSYVGANESVQKSEKDLTLAIKEGVLSDYFSGSISSKESELLSKFK